MFVDYLPEVRTGKAFVNGGGVFSVDQEHLWREGDRGSPRFTLLIVDVAGDGYASVVPCAVVLIPRGRDRDFMFSSLEGLQQARAKESKSLSFN